MSALSHERSSSAHRLRAGLLVVVLLGALIGLGTSLLAQLEPRWIVYALLALASLLVLAIAPDKDRLLTTVFLLGLQIDVYLRLFYGRADSREGLAIPFAILPGIALVAWRLLHSGPAHLRTFRLGGMARWPILAILLTTALSVITTEERFVGVSHLAYELELFFVYWLAFNIVRSDADFRRMLGLLLVMLVTQSLILYVQNVLGLTFSMVGDVMERGEVPRPGGTVSTQPAGFSSFITPPLFIAFAYAYARGNQWRPRGALIAAALGAAAIGLTFTRASWAGFVIGLAVLSIMLARRAMARWSRIVGTALVLALAGMLLLPTMTQRLSSDYGADVNPQAAAWEERWGLMRIAFNMIEEHPLTGVGPGAYSHTYKSYIPPDLKQWTFVVHNEFLRRAAETGVPGAIAFVALLVAGLRVGWRLTRSDRSELVTTGAAWLAALVSLIWQMSWVPWNGFSFNAMLYLMLGLTDAACRFQPSAAIDLPRETAPAERPDSR